MKQPLDHGNVDAVEVRLPPIAQEVSDDMRAEFEGGVVERGWGVFGHGAVGEGDGTDA